MKCGHGMLSLALVVGIAPGITAEPDQGSRSARAAGALVSAMTAQKLEAAAARDPDDPTRFIAALLYPGAQLLVVSAAYPVPQQLEQRLDQREYREIYMDLQSAGSREGRFFVTDLRADGLRRIPGEGEPFDIVYEDGVQSAAYDGNWSSQKMNQAKYNAKFEADDKRYARLLQALTNEVRRTPGTWDRITGPAGDRSASPSGKT